MTWGVFPGQEITQSTIIETESFLSWKVDTFVPWMALPILTCVAGRGLLHVEGLGVILSTAVSRT